MGPISAKHESLKEYNIYSVIRVWSVPFNYQCWILDIKKPEVGLAKVIGMEWISQDAIISTVCMCYLGVVLKWKPLVDWDRNTYRCGRKGEKQKQKIGTQPDKLFHISAPTLRGIKNFLCCSLSKLCYSYCVTLSNLKPIIALKQPTAKSKPTERRPTLSIWNLHRRSVGIATWPANKVQ